MKDYSQILAIDPSKFDEDDAIAFLNAYKDPLKVLIHIWTIEKIQEIMKWKKDETMQLVEIIWNAITHCTIAVENPTAITYDQVNAVTIPWPLIYSQEYVDHTRSILPILEELHRRILNSLYKE